MIEQDNRPKTNTFEDRIKHLQNLLNEPVGQEKKQEKIQHDPFLAKDKVIFIYINGNHNNIGWQSKKELLFF